MKTILIVLLSFCIFAFHVCSGQSKFGDSLNAKEYNFFYKDSSNNKVSFGNYEPTGFVSLSDGSLIVSTEISFYHSEYFQPGDYFSKDSVKCKWQSRGGSVFSLNSKFEKKWEVFFKAQYRAMKIIKLKDETVIVAGERTDMTKFWMAHIDSQGKIMWFKEYRLKYHVTVSNMTKDSLDNIFLLARAESNIFLLKINSKGKLLWKKCLDRRKRFEKFGYELFADKNIFASSSYEGFVKVKNVFVRQRGKRLYEVNTNGKVIKVSEIDGQFNYRNWDSSFYCTTSNDTIILYKNELPGKAPTDTIILLGDRKFPWIYGSQNTQKVTYLFGSKDHNLGYIIVQLDKRNICNGYWTDNRTESSELVDAIVKTDGTIIILGKGYRSPSLQDLTIYLNITVLKKKSSLNNYSPILK